MTVHLGPVGPGIDGLAVNPGGPLAYNPRCLSRDISAWTSQHWMAPENVLNLTVGAAAANVRTFQDELQGRFGDGFLGTHTSGHVCQALWLTSLDLDSGTNYLPDDCQWRGI